MPQNRMFDDQPPTRGLMIILNDLTLDLLDGLDVRVRTIDTTGRPTTRAAVRLHGVEVDYLDTLVSTVATAFMYGPADELAREVAAVHKLARKHRRSHTG